MGEVRDVYRGERSGRRESRASVRIRSHVAAETRGSAYDNFRAWSAFASSRVLHTINGEGTVVSVLLLNL